MIKSPDLKFSQNTLFLLFNCPYRALGHSS
jgi:hypothetical protein